MAKRRTHNQRNNMNANKNRNNKNTPKKERDQTEDSETYIAEDNDQVKEQSQNGVTPLRSSLSPPKGLSNLGNTCFFNSVMQNLCRTPGLLFALNHINKQEKMKFESKTYSTLYCSPAPMDKLSKQLMDFLIMMEHEETSESKITSSGRNRRSNARNKVISPQQLLNKICNIAPRFRGFQQQDSQELFHALLDGLKSEEIKRRKQAILSEMNLLSKKAKEVNDETRNRVKNYGHEATSRPTLVNLLFSGILVSSVLCDECGTITQVYEEFLDISLPIVESFQLHNHSELNKKNSKQSDHREKQDQQRSSEETENQPTTPGNSKHGKKKMKKQNKKQHRRAGKHAIADEKTKEEVGIEEEEMKEADVQYNEAVMNILTQNLEHLQLQSTDESHVNLGIDSSHGVGGKLELISGVVEQKETSALREELDESMVENGDHGDSFKVENGKASDIKMQNPVDLHTAQKDVACLEKEIAKDDRKQGTDHSLALDNGNHNIAVIDASGSLHTNENAPVKMDSELSCSITSFSTNKRSEEINPDKYNLMPEDTHTVQDAHTEMDHSSLAEKVPVPQETNCPNGHVVMNSDLKLEHITKNSDQLPLCVEENNRQDDHSFKPENLEVPSKLSAKPQSEQESEIMGKWEGEGVHVERNRISGEEKEEGSDKLSSISEDPELLSGNDEKELSDDEKLKAGKIQSQMGKDPSLFETPLKETRKKVTSFCDKLPTTLSQIYEPKNGECSVLSCLRKFTMAEMLTGNNKFGCEKCTKDSCQGGKNPKTVYCNASKQMLINTPPLILTVHLKRFQQAGRGLRKLSKHVKIPEEIDLSPFCCSESREHLDDEGQLLYRIYGIIEHSGSLTRGHYTSYVKVHAENERLVTNLASKLNKHATDEMEYTGNGEEDGDESWYHISDTSVTKKSLSQALNSNAYLLFYERIFG